MTHDVGVMNLILLAVKAGVGWLVSADGVGDGTISWCLSRGSIAMKGWFFHGLALRCILNES